MEQAATCARASFVTLETTALLSCPFHSLSLLLWCSWCQQILRQHQKHQVLPSMSLALMRVLMEWHWTARSCFACACEGRDHDASWEEK